MWSSPRNPATYGFGSRTSGSRWLRLGLVALAAAVVAAVGMSSAPRATKADFDNETATFLTIINAHRQQNGLGPFAVDAKLQRAADWHSNDQLNTRNCPGQPDPGPNACDHTDTLGRSASDRIWTGFGYAGNANAENIYWGNPGNTAQGAFDSWRTSEGHNANMLNPAYTAIGIARLCRADGWCFWTTTFGDIVDEPFAPAVVSAP